MMSLDLRGEAVTGANAASLALFEQALAEFQCYVADPVATVERAIAESPKFVMAHCLKAYLLLCGTEAGLARNPTCSLQLTIDLVRAPSIASLP